MSNNDAKCTFYCVIFNNNNNNNPIIGILNNFSQAKLRVCSILNKFWQNINQMKFFLFFQLDIFCCKWFYAKTPNCKYGIQKLCTSPYHACQVWSRVSSYYPHHIPQNIDTLRILLLLARFIINLNSFHTTSKKERNK